jgi:hypothetical protein
MKRLYYKRANRKSLVSFDGDSNIPALLDEYPLKPRKERRNAIFTWQ